MGDPLPDDEVAHTALVDRLRTLALVPPSGAGTSEAAVRLSGRTVTVEAGSTGVTSFGLDDTGDLAQVTFTVGGSTTTVPVGRGRWEVSRVAAPWTGPDDIVAVSGVWPAPDTLVLTFQRVMTPFCLTATAVVDGDTVRVAVDANVGFGSPHLAELVGMAEPA